MMAISNWFKNNTPKFWQIVGDIGLFVASLSAFLMALPEIMQASGFTGFVLPAFLITVNKWCLIVGAVVKFLTKFVGKNGTPDNTEGKQG